MNIYLIGLPGVGKSTIGKQLAERIGYEFVDLDQYIEQQAMLFVDEIFHLYGEPYFRALETNALKDFKGKDRVVIACGGGIIKDRKNKDWMEGICIYLSAPLSVIQKRLDESLVERPILSQKSLEVLYEERKEAYAYFKDMEISATTPEATLEAIVQGIGETK